MAIWARGSECASPDEDDDVDDSGWPCMSEATFAVVVSLMLIRRPRVIFKFCAVPLCRHFLAAPLFVLPLNVYVGKQSFS